MQASSSRSVRWYVASSSHNSLYLLVLQVSRLVRENLTYRAMRFNLVLDDVSITHVAFSPEFTHAVEAKQVAQQTALRAAFLVDQAIQEKQVSYMSYVHWMPLTKPFSLSLYGHKEKPVVLN